MIKILTYKNPDGQLRVGKFIEMNQLGKKRYYPVIISDGYLAEENEIVKESVFMPEGTKAMIYGRANNEFGDWMRTLGCSDQGLCIADFDWIIWNYKTRNLMFLEEKRTLKPFSNTWLKIFKKTIFDKAMSEFAAKNNINYKGYNLVKFTNTNPKDGKTYWSSDFEHEEEITEDELKRRILL